jgi:predicted nucleic acid-binding protein
MIVILDSSILIGLGAIGRLALLHDLFGEVIIPQAVADEVIDYGRDPDTSRQIAEAPWIKTVRVKNELAVRVLLHPFGIGEAEVIVLSQELSGTDAILVGVDERLACEKLENLGVDCVGILGILLRAKRAGLIERVRPEIEALRRIKFAMSQALIEIILDMAGEFSG